jgi:hypothetical protein
MLVFKDIREIWSMPFEGAKVIIQDEVPESIQPKGKIGAPHKRIRQCSVMLLDCGSLEWDPVNIIGDLDGRYSYEDLVYNLCILEEREIKGSIPFRWNSLEYWEPDTGLIHYTDMLTQPWVSPANPYGYLWLDELRRMLKSGVIDEREIETEISLGYVRPSLMREIQAERMGRAAPPDEVAEYIRIDREAGFVMHKEVYEAKRRREAAIKEYMRTHARPASRFWQWTRRFASRR